MRMRPRHDLTSSVVLVLASADAVAGITAGATLAAAVILACITAWTTNERQKRDLMAEAERQSEALSHQREIHDIGDLRMLLDQAALALNDAGDAIEMMLEANAEHGAVGQDVRDRVAKCEQMLVAPLMRLHVRLGRYDPIVVHFREAYLATVRWQFSKNGIEDTWSTFDRAKDEFLFAAVSRAGTRTVGPFGKQTE
ncbi:MAG: hypothetical protein ACHQDY_01830 [Solirubrobacterales bacterium]